MENCRPHDKEEQVINPLTGEFDTVRIFDPNRILTSEYIHTGSIRAVYDTASATYVQDNPVIVIDNHGNVVTN